MENLVVIKVSYLIPLLPLLGAMVAGFLCTGKRKTLAHWPIWLTVGTSAAMSIWLLVDMLGLWEKGAKLYYVQDWYNWITAGNFNAKAGFFFDPLTAVMLCVVTAVGFLITLFSKGYMAGEKGYFRFFAFLGLFIFMMTTLVMGNNFILLYLGWEGVGLSSYLLIGYYYERPTAREAAKKAFLVNRVGDFGFGVGIMLIFLVFGSVSYFGSGNEAGVLSRMMDGQFIASLPAWKQQAISWIPFLLMIGAFGKSAQFPLYVWLPDAMEGPTPVSALIHAATMVTAGVYMVVRCGTLFVGNEAAMATVAVVGAFTALFAATIAMRQFDLKKVFAYSTVSQLGYMFVGAAVLAPVAGIFHLMTHAFFKALLFLASGIVMHAMLGELDMRKMSGLKRVLPKTRWLMLIGCLTLAGFPFFSAFFSKDEIIAAAWVQNKFLAISLLLTAFLTAYYTFRLYFRVFEGPEVVPANEGSHGQGHGGHDAHDGHESHNPEPGIMAWPLVILAVGAIFAGYLNFPERERDLGKFLGQSPSLGGSFVEAGRRYEGQREVNPISFGQEDRRRVDRHELEAEHVLHIQMMVISGLIAALGISLAYVFHLKNRTAGEKLAERFAPVVRVLDAKYWVDEIYQRGIVEPLRGAGYVFFAIDRMVIDGIVWLVGFVPQLSGFVLKLTTQRGYLQGYATTMLFGVVVILAIVLLWI